jgi:hypothetical protein
VPRTTWLVASNTAQLTHPWLFRAQLVAVNDGVAAWRFAGSATSDPHCLDATPAPTSGTNGDE